MKRTDGRGKGTLRPLACEFSCLTSANGSAMWKSGSAHTIAAVYGPVAPQNSNFERENSARISVMIKPGTPSSTGSGNHRRFSKQYETELEQFLTDVLTSCVDVALFPRCVIEVVLQIVHQDGSLLSCLLHASVAALIDSGVDLLYLPVGTTCLIKPYTISNKGNNNNNSSSSGINKDGGRDGDEATSAEAAATTTKASIWIDPTSVEEEEEDDTTIVFLVNEERHPGKILGSRTVGSGVSLDEYLSCVQISTKACPAVLSFWRLAVEHKLKRESRTLWSR